MRSTAATVTMIGVLTAVLLIRRRKVGESELAPAALAAATQEFAAQQSRQDRQNAVEYVKQVFQLLVGAATLLSTILIGLGALTPAHSPRGCCSSR